MDLLDQAILVVVGVLVGAAATNILQRAPAVWRVLRGAFCRLGRAVNFLRKFVLARKMTRINMRAEFMSRRSSLPLLMALRV